MNYEKWTKYGAERDVLDMIYNLAVFYNEKNKLSEAEYWYQKAANKGHRDAEYNLALVHGKEEKYSEAEKYGINKGEMEAEDTIWQSIMRLIISLTRQNNCIKK